MKRLLTALISTLLIWACSGSGSDMSGATSETTNGIALHVADARQKPLAHVHVNLYSKETLNKLDSATTDDSGVAYVKVPVEECYLEGIAGSDSALMAWNNFDSTQKELVLEPSASVVVRMDSAEAASLQMVLAETPYMALWRDGAFVFAHVPAGKFDLLLGDSAIVEMSLDAGETLDTVLTSAISEPDTVQLDSAGIFTFEDFEDGDSLNNLAKYYPNHGWYFSSMGDCKWTRPEDGRSFDAVQDSSADHGYFLSAQYDIGDSGMVILGTHLGTDSLAFDMSGLTAIRVTYRSNGNLNLGLENAVATDGGAYNKAMWNLPAAEKWTEIELKPGDEILKPSANQLEWNEVSKEIALLSFFIQDGSFFELDKIVFEGVNFVYYAP